MIKIMRRLIGDKGEDSAVNYLKKAGYKIIDRNFNTRGGEIDIIAGQKNMIIFVEVKTRSSSSFGYGYEAVTKSKQDKIIKTANNYIIKNKLENNIFRFDIISIDEGKINHIENAFTLE